MKWLLLALHTIAIGLSDAATFVLPAGIVNASATASSGGGGMAVVYRAGSTVYAHNVVPESRPNDLTCTASAPGPGYARIKAVSYGNGYIVYSAFGPDIYQWTFATYMTCSLTASTTFGNPADVLPGDGNVNAVAWLNKAVLIREVAPHPSSNPEISIRVAPEASIFTFSGYRYKEFSTCGNTWGDPSTTILLVGGVDSTGSLADTYATITLQTDGTITSIVSNTTQPAPWGTATHVMCVYYDGGYVVTGRREDNSAFSYRLGNEEGILAPPAFAPNIGSVLADVWGAHGPMLFGGSSTYHTATLDVLLPSCPNRRLMVTTQGRGSCAHCYYATPLRMWDESECYMCMLPRYYSESLWSCVECPPDSVPMSMFGPCTKCDHGMYVRKTVPPLPTCETCNAGWVPRVDLAGCTACNPGETAQPGDILCTECTENTYAATPASPSCKACPNNTISGIAADACTACAPGTYRIPDMTACTACGPGTYKTANMDQCTRCIPNTVFTGAATGCAPCDEGTDSTHNTLECTACAAGTHRNSSMTACTLCEPGTISAQGSITCTGCPWGHTSNHNHTSCVACPPGTFRGSEATGCTACPPGSYSGNGSTQCTPCGIGYVSNDGGLSCSACAGNTYRAAGETWCTPCARNTIAPEGSGECMPCQAGYTRETGWNECRACQAGYYRDSEQDVCTMCTPGTYSIGNGTACAACPPGTVPNTERAACVQCPALYYKDTHMPNCSLCALGHVPTATRDACEPCPAGTTRTNADVSCRPCGPLEVAQEGSSECTTCAPGTAPGTNGDTCEHCGQGYYRAAGMGMCTACAAGHYSTYPFTECIPCQDGSIAATQGSGECTPCGIHNVAINGTVCNACPNGHVTPDGIHCGPCQEGAVPSAHAEACIPCAEGTVPSSNLLVCVACPTVNHSTRTPSVGGCTQYPHIDGPFVVELVAQADAPTDGPMLVSAESVKRGLPAYTAQRMAEYTQSARWSEVGHLFTRMLDYSGREGVSAEEAMVLDARGVTLTDTDAVHIAAVLPYARVKHINLQNNTFTDAGVYIMASVLERCRGFHSFYMLADGSVSHATETTYANALMRSRIGHGDVDRYVVSTHAASERTWQIHNGQRDVMIWDRYIGTMVAISPHGRCIVGSTSKENDRWLALCDGVQFEAADLTPAVRWGVGITDDAKTLLCEPSVAHPGAPVCTIADSVFAAHPRVAEACLLSEYVRRNGGASTRDAFRPSHFDDIRRAGDVTIDEIERTSLPDALASPLRIHGVLDKHTAEVIRMCTRSLTTDLELYDAEITHDADVALADLCTNTVALVRTQADSQHITALFPDRCRIGGRSIAMSGSWPSCTNGLDASALLVALTSSNASEVDISGNCMNDGRVSQIVAAIATSSTLHRLYLHTNTPWDSIQQETATQLADAISGSVTLVRVTANNTGTDEAVYHAMRSHTRPGLEQDAREYDGTPPQSTTCAQTVTTLGERCYGYPDRLFTLAYVAELVRTLTDEYGTDVTTVYTNESTCAPAQSAIASCRPLSAIGIAAVHSRRTLIRKLYSNAFEREVGMFHAEIHRLYAETYTATMRTAPGSVSEVSEAIRSGESKSARLTQPEGSTVRAELEALTSIIDNEAGIEEMELESNIHTTWDDDATAALVSTLSLFPTVQSITLRMKGGASPGAMSALLTHLANRPGVAHLGLSVNGLDTSWIREIGTAVSAMEDLRSLNLSDHSFADAGPLGVFVEYNTHIDTLDVTPSTTQTTGAVEIASRLVRNVAITTLRMGSMCPTGERERQELENILSQRVQLTDNDCGITVNTTRIVENRLRAARRPWLSEGVKVRVRNVTGIRTVTYVDPDANGGLGRVVVE